MLIRFVTKNFRSIKDEIELSMIPNKVRDHKLHVIRSDNQSEYDLLKSAIIYGANASGKSNLVEAMRFAQNMITHGREAKRPIPIVPFRLDPTVEKQLSRFEFEIKIEGQTYSYGFELDSSRVHAEWLYETGKTRKPKMLFERETNDSGTVVKFGDTVGGSREDREVLKILTTKGIRENRLLLTVCQDLEVTNFEHIMRWFRKTLVIFAPPSSRTSKMEVKLSESDQLREQIVEILRRFDIDLSSIGYDEIELKDETQLEQLSELLPTDANAAVIGISNQRMIIRRNSESGDLNLLSFDRLVTRRKRSDGEVIDFDIGEESDGTLRVIDLLSGFLGSLDEERVFIVDELDRSLHPLLTYKFIEFFLHSTVPNPNQLVVTTHESSLLNLKLLRRDEIWFIEKDRKTGASTLYSLEEFAPRNDKDVRKGYLHGRYGAIPFTRNMNDLGWGG